MQLSKYDNDFLYYGVTEGLKSGYAPNRTFAICGRLKSLSSASIRINSLIIHLNYYLYLTKMLKLIIFHLGFGS